MYLRKRRMIIWSFPWKCPLQNGNIKFLNQRFPPENPLQILFEPQQDEGSKRFLQVLHNHHLQDPVERSHSRNFELDPSHVDNPEI